MISLATYYVIVKKGGNPGVYLQIYSYISSSLSLNTKFGTIVLRHQTAQYIPTFILSSTSTSSQMTEKVFTETLRINQPTNQLHRIFSLACFVSSVQQHLASIPQQSSLCYALDVLTTLFYWCGAPHPGPGCQALKEGSLR